MTGRSPGLCAALVKKAETAAIAKIAKNSLKTAFFVTFVYQVEI
jgi:hypothetical protein